MLISVSGFLYFTWYEPQHPSTARTTYCGKRSRLMTSIARSHELNTFYNFLIQILDNFRENKKSKRQMNFITSLFSLLFLVYVQKDKGDQMQSGIEKRCVVKKSAAALFQSNFCGCKLFLSQYLMVL